MCIRDRFGVACKAGAVDKTEVGIPEKCKGVGASMCNPIHQAMRLNKEETDLNILVGLCVGPVSYTHLAACPAGFQSRAE